VTVKIMDIDIFKELKYFGPLVAKEIFGGEGGFCLSVCS
jgi:hypothetical protein